VDVLCVWSPWFAERLHRISPIYDARNTAVTGRVRYDPPRVEPVAASPLRVLVIGEAGPAFANEVRPYLDALEAARGIATTFRPHPAIMAGREVERVEDSLAEAILANAVVVGIRSSALLEALWHERPVIVLGSQSGDIASDFASAGLASRCADPADLARAVFEAASPEGRANARRARDRVWGGAPPDSADALIRAGEVDSPRSPAVP
jgi:hypothetical protein